MIEQTLIEEIQTLPESLKQEVLHFVQFLKQKQAAKIEPAKPRKKRRTGSAKGMFVMSDTISMNRSKILQRYVNEI